MATTQWAIVGCYGQLGRALVAHLPSRGETVSAAVDVDVLDITDGAATERFVRALPPPAVVVNAAAYTHVDRCEREPDVAHRINALGPKHLGDACLATGAKLVHVSTDYIFAGDSERPYTETDEPAPRSAYGRTKLEGELHVREASDEFLVVRTSWVFGEGRNFIAAILAQAEARRAGEASGPLRVVDDQRGRPTYAVDLAEALVALVLHEAQGAYHVANAGTATWWDVARLTLDEAGFSDLSVERARTADLELDAPRPAWSVLDCSKAEALGVRVRPWPDAVRAYLRSPVSPRVRTP